MSGVLACNGLQTMHILFWPVRVLLTVLSFSTIALALPAQAAGNAWYENPQIVVELYTSQGCSSCPPADRLITNLTGCDRIHPLGFHVDYWNYLGWKDEFADKAYTQRQVRYANEFGNSTIYTPQIIVQGERDMVGSYEREVTAAIKKTASRLDENRFRLDPRTMRISGIRPGKALTLTLVQFDPGVHRIAIGAGENRGRNIEYVNVVTGIREFKLRTSANNSVKIPNVAANIVRNADQSISLLLHEQDSQRILSSWVRHAKTWDRQDCLEDL